MCCVLRWGGNLKGIWLNMNQYYPDLMSYVSSTGGINVMTYDLSDNEQVCILPTLLLMSWPQTYQQST